LPENVKDLLSVTAPTHVTVYTQLRMITLAAMGWVDSWERFTDTNTTVDSPAEMVCTQN
jgi:hypothetical protein